MQLLSCVCDILAIFFSELRLLAQIIDLVADIVYCMCGGLCPFCVGGGWLTRPVDAGVWRSVQACMQAQTHLELKLHPTAADYEITQSAYTAKQPL